MIQRTIPGIVLHDVEHFERNEKERRANQNEIERNDYSYQYPNYKLN